MDSILKKVTRVVARIRLFLRVSFYNFIVARRSPRKQSGKPVVFFNASARLVGLNLNAAFAMISSWGTQLAGKPVYHLACQSGMSHCVLGAGLGEPLDPPPCQRCIRYSKLFSGAAPTFWISYQIDQNLEKELKTKSVLEMMDVDYQNRPLGKLVLPSLRWILRRHDLGDDELTRSLFSEFILSAHNIAEKFSKFLNHVDPEAVVVFNGLQYPEAVVKWVAQKSGIRVITHEVNLQPFSAFFTEGEATIYPLNIPSDFQLSDHQNNVLDHYLERRFRGDFSMAGIKFWSSMDHLSDDFSTYASQFDNLVPVFTNVIFDTSQAHANTIFQDMFEWLNLVVDQSQKYPRTLFVIRAHPDEMRKGKQSQQGVAAWADELELQNRPNIYLIGPDETFSSYELILRSKFCLVYNSSIGLEATLLGKPVLCAGRARYTQYPIVYYPENKTEYLGRLESFLEGDSILIPEDYLQNARRFLFFQLYRASLPFEEFLTEGESPGYVSLKEFSWLKLKPGTTPVIDVIVNGLLNGDDFILETDPQ